MFTFHKKESDYNMISDFHKSLQSVSFSIDRKKQDVCVAAYLAKQRRGKGTTRVLIKRSLSTGKYMNDFLR